MQIQNKQRALLLVWLIYSGILPTLQQLQRES